MVVLLVVRRKLGEGKVGRVLSFIITAVLSGRKKDPNYKQHNLNFLFSCTGVSMLSEKLKMVIITMFG